jgi:hypothetical protein
MGISRSVVTGLVSLGLWAIGAGVARAEPAPMIASAPPVALKQGESIDVAFTGQNLANVAGIPVADARGVTVTIVKPEKPDPNTLHCKIAAAQTAALGDREFRLIGPAGATKALHLFVSQFPIVAEKEPNNQPAEAQDVALPATLLGKIAEGGDVDQFRFQAVKGQRLVFDLYAARIGSPLDPVVTIHSLDGKEMRPIVEHHVGDPVVIFEAPQDGQYLLQLRDLQFRGGADYDYRIVAGRLPYVETILPSSGEPGKVVTAQAIGYNLEGGDKITIDLTNSPPGRLEVRAKTPLGESNAIPFEVTELPQAVESEPNNDPQNANPVSLPVEVSAHVDQPGDVDYYKFHLAYKQTVNLEVLAGRYGSPVTPLLQLRSAHGDVIENNDGAPNSDARIVRELEAGDYMISVRDLTFAGGPGYWYRLKIDSAMRVQQDFSVHFLPDAPRLHRGGNVAMWCEVTRLNGFKGDVTLVPEGVPAGVSVAPITIGDDVSGWFTLSAAPDAAIGTTPFRLRGTATIGGVPIVRYAEPETDGRTVHDAYLTVLEAAPFNVESVAMMTPQRLQQLNAELGALAVKLNTPNPKFDASLAAWEKKASDRPAWTVLNPATAASAKSTPLIRQADGSFMASGNFPAQDEYTVTAHTDLKGITAIRLEVLSDERLPGHGPGAAPNGNFVLTEFKVLAAKEGQPPQPVALKNAYADYAQPNFPIAAAIDNNPATGWAVDAQEGRSHTATFQTAMPIGSDEGTALTFVLEHQSGFASHNIGRFRISVTNADPSLLNAESDIPPEVAAVVFTPSEQRTPEQKNELANYFRTIDPDTAADRSRLDSLRSFVAPYAEMERLETAMKAESPELKKDQEQWEKAMEAGDGWSVLRVDRMKSASGAFLEREPDGSVFAGGASPSNDTYDLIAARPMKGITAIRLELLPDPRLPGNGPGRSPDGNFILTRFRITESAKGSAPRDVEIADAKASVEQDKYGIAGALDDKDETGWAIAPNVGQPVEAMFYLKELTTGSGPLTIRLEQLAKLPQFTIGRLRLWATSNKEPDAAARPPERIVSVLARPEKARTEEQKRELAVYFRSIAPSLIPLRRRLADLKEEVPTLPIRIQKNRKGSIPVPINRVGGFAGDVSVTLEGFAAGREGNLPAPISREIKLNPLVIAGGKYFGALTFDPERREETGTRMVVLKAEAKVGSETIVEYSPAFPLTIEK